MSKFIPQGLGWVPDLPDHRDYTFRHEKVLPLFKKLRPSDSAVLTDSVDLRYGDDGELFFTDPGDQGLISSSTAFAVLDLVEYFERRIHGQSFEGSKRFLYKVTRNLRSKQQTCVGDTGADLRSTLKALAVLGVPKEADWPYDQDRFNDEPSAFIYQLARRIDGLRYFRIDTPLSQTASGSEPTRWNLLTEFLSAGFPIAFGFSVPSSLTDDANIPYRPDLDGIRGGQAVLAVGYRLHHFGRNQHALLVRSSWGHQWGDNGNGWLPMNYVQNQLARDFWTVVCDRWLDSTELSRPNCIAPHLDTLNV